MATCQFPNCGKTLVGREKLFCTSCKDKIKSGAWTAFKWTGKALLALLTLVPTALLYLRRKSN